MRDLFRARPVVSVVALELLQVVFVLAGAAALAWLFPGLPGYSLTGWSQSLVLVLFCAGILLALIAVFGWWVPAGFTRPRDWRQFSCRSVCGRRSSSPRTHSSFHARRLVSIIGYGAPDRASSPPTRGS